jgi:nicotinamidase-related amidase
MSTNLSLLNPNDCALLLVDQQAGLAFGVGSEDRQVLLNNATALARTARAFGIPIVASTSATKVYSGRMMPALHAAIPDVVPIERRNMNIWEDDHVRSAVEATGRKRLAVRYSISISPSFVHRTSYSTD